MSAEDAEKMALLQQENSALRERVARLEQATAKLDTLWSMMSGVVIVLDGDGRHLDIAPTAMMAPDILARMMGVSVRDVFPPDVAGEILAAIRRALASGEPVTLEYPIPLPDGVLWHRATCKRLEDSSVLWVAHDVTVERLLKQTERELRVFEVLAGSAPDGVSVLSRDGAFSYANRAYRALTGHGEGLLQETVFDVHAEPREVIDRALQQALATGYWEGPLTIVPPGGQSLPCQVSFVKLPAGEGEQAPSLAAITRDMTPFVEAERQRLALQQQIIEAQRAALSELSTPLLPLADGVIAMPLIGAIDSARAQEVLEKLLHGIVRQQAHTAILDITGVREVDAQGADALLGVARAARLLGTQLVLTGIGPEVAQTLVQLQADLSGIITQSNLQSGIAFALRGAGAGPRAAGQGRARG
jgi:rsbT co-antagonist protein RsbR